MNIKSNKKALKNYSLDIFFIQFLRRRLFLPLLHQILMRPNHVDIREIFTIESNTIDLNSEEYDFHNKEIEINFPLVLKSLTNSTIICSSIIILSSNVNIYGLNIKGSIVLRNVDNVTIQNTTMSDSDTGTGGSIVITHGNDIKLQNIFISNISTPGIFVESESTIQISNCSLQNINTSMIYLSDKVDAYIENCILCKSNSNAIYFTKNSSVEIHNTEIHHVKMPAIFSISSSLTCTDSFIHDTNSAICLTNCYNSNVLKNTFNDIDSSCISTIVKSHNSFISENTFSNVNGNCVFVSEDSNATIVKNKLFENKYPVFAVLQLCSVQISDNIIKNVQKSGICIRGAKRAVINSNEIDTVGDCGISISDSTNCVLMKNTIKNSHFAAIEAYNETSVNISNNEVVNCGDYGIMVYTGADVTASKNKFVDMSKSFVFLSTKGKGKFTKNEIVKCGKLFEGDTTEPFLFSDNVPFESVTNDPQYQDEEKIQLLPKFEDPYRGKCLNCKTADRSGFLIPCGHRIYCEKCGIEAAKNNLKCPLCRFEITNFTSGFSSSTDQVCSICLDKPANSIIIPCGHTGFCENCLNEWFSSKFTCPVCRTEGAIFKRIITDI